MGRTLENYTDKARAVLAQLDARGIDINIITQKLEEQGIVKFKKAYYSLLNAIEKKKHNQSVLKKSA